MQNKAEISIEDLQKVKTLANPQTGLRNPFPLDALPPAVQSIVEETNKTLNFPVDFIAASLLFTSSVAIGNAFHVEIKHGYMQNAVIYLALVARRGFNKSHPLSFAVKPLEEKDSVAFEQYRKEKNEMDHNQSLSKKDKESQGMDESQTPLPSWKQFLITDFTPEALVKVHRINPKGIGVYYDELAGWIANFNRYNKGSQEQFWLSAWSGKPIRVNRVNSEPEFLKQPYISVAGTIQPGVLEDIAKKRTENGFIDRMLFAIRDDIKKAPLNDKELSPEISRSWNNIVENLLNVNNNPNEASINERPPKVLQFASDAKARFFEYQKQLTDLSNDPANEPIAGVFSKMEMYTMRFALILESLYAACAGGSVYEISLRSVESAIKLSDYFMENAKFVYYSLVDTNSAERLLPTQRSFYFNLPETFLTKDAVKMGNSSNISERTVKRLLNRKDLFTKIQTGKYERLY